MTFRLPAVLWLLAVIPIAAAFLLARERHRRHVARRFASEQIRGVSNTLRPIRPWLLSVALALAVAAVAGPRAGFMTVRYTAHETNRIVVIDVSNSMAANDVGTTRLSAAKAIARRIFSTYAGRVALIEFEAAPVVVAPLTNDADAVIELLETIEPGEAGHPGSDLGGAIGAAISLAESDAASRADIIVISDGEDQGRDLQRALARAKERGIAVSTIAIGSTSGSTIPLGEGKGDLRDESGRTVTTYAHPDALREIADATGGVFLENPFSAHALDAILAVRHGGTAREAVARIPIERYQWPLGLSLLLLLCGSIANRGAE